MGGWWWYRAESVVSPAEITSFLCLVLFKDRGRKVSSKFHLFLSDVNQENEEAG